MKDFTSRRIRARRAKRERDRQLSKAPNTARYPEGEENTATELTGAYAPGNEQLKLHQWFINHYGDCNYAKSESE
jgi:hypothetical protein